MTRVLIVDDEPDVRLMANLTLRSTGWDVDEAASGDEALERTAMTCYDAVVLDQRMPGRSGIDTAEELLARGGSERVVLFSAYLTPELEDTAARLGVRVLDKAAIRELRDAVTELLHR